MSIRSAFALMLLLSGASDAANTCLRYGDPTVSLKGKVVLHTFFGPPGYGENPKSDSREKQALLLLDEPICVDATRDEAAATNQREITLVPLGNFGMSSFTGRRVTVAGSLFHAHTGHHHTQVLIQLEHPPSALQRTKGDGVD